MNARDEILELNLQRLFARSYQPVAPTAEFRSRLATVLARASTATRAPIQRPVLRRVLTAAGIVLALAAGILVWRAAVQRGETLAEMLARGCVAIREHQEQDWRALDGAAARRGFEGDHDMNVRVRTPAAVPFQVRDRSSAAVTIDPASDAQVVAELDLSHYVELRAGSVRIENLAATDRWDLLGPRGQNVTLERGSLTARVAECEAGACLYVRLENGSATAYAGGYALQVGVEVALGDGRVLSAMLSAPDDAASHRTSAAVSAGPSSSTPEPAPPSAPVASLTGVIARGEGDPAIGAYIVTLLRHERLPAISLPQSHAFDGAERFTIRPLKPGTYDVFVEIKGRAPWRTCGVEIAAAQVHEITITATSGVSVAGRVIADSTGKPIENALVLLEDLIPAQVIPFDSDQPYRAAARTDSSGTFRIEHVPAGTHVLRATAASFGAAWTTLVDIDVSGKIELRLPLPGRLAGRVARDDGQPWRGARIVASFMRPTGALDRFSYGFAIANDEGRYSMPDLPAGDYVLLNVSDTTPGNEAPTSRQVHVNAGETTTADLPEAIDGPRFFGRVLDADGRPLAGLDVTLQPRGIADDSNWRSQRSGANGEFTFAGLPAAVYDVFVGESLGERFTWVEEITVPKGGALEHDVKVGAGRIRGRATSDAATIGGAFVLLLRAERDQFVFAGRVRTDANGAFELERLQPSTYRVIVYPAQKGLAPRTSADLWIAPSRLLVECELAVERGASLSIVVHDSNGTALAGARLAFRDGAGQPLGFRENDVTGADGRYAIDGIAAGRWTVTATTSAGATATSTIELLVGDERELVLTIP